MAMAQEYGGVLQRLQTVWDNLSLLDNCRAPGLISAIPARLSDLASDLLNQLGTEALKKTLRKRAPSAQSCDQYPGQKSVRANRRYRILACDRIFARSCATQAMPPIDRSGLRRCGQV
jgi:hypothetical protein